MMRTLLATLLVLSLSLCATGCGNDFSSGERAQIYVKVGSSDNPTEYRFQKIGANDPALHIPLEIYNDGTQNLTVSEIYLEEGGNKYIQLIFNGLYQQDDLPVVLEPGLSILELGATLIYDPEDGVVDTSTSTLVIVSDDPDYKGNEWKYEITLGIEAVGPTAQLSKPSIIYSCVTGCSTDTITLENDGTDTLLVTAIHFKNASTEFELPSLPPLPLEIGLKGSDNYNPVVLSVRYCPEGGFDDSNVLVIETNDFSNYPEGSVQVPISVSQSPAILEISTDSAFGYLDFTGEGGTHSVNIYNKQASECDNMCPVKGTCCGCPIQITGMEITPADAGDWYSVVPRDPGSGDELSLPRAIKGGAGMAFDVSYNRPAGQTDDRNGELCVNYNSPGEGPMSYCVSLVAKSQCEFTIAPPNYVLHFASMEATTIKEKPVLLINNGAGVCDVNRVWVTDDFSGVSDAFAIKDGEQTAIQVAPFTIEQLTVQYAPVEDTSSGLLHIEYEDPPGRYHRHCRDPPREQGG